mmetsp:Transcript_10747/g.29895  ORF Transcript_10747/g.29895 Transcript_10747/m.29895 type:complete len:265 (+) Transcript_10747:464-1258(+)
MPSLVQLVDVRAEPSLPRHLTQLLQPPDGLLVPSPREQSAHDPKRMIALLPKHLRKICPAVVPVQVEGTRQEKVPVVALLWVAHEVACQPLLEIFLKSQTVENLIQLFPGLERLHDALDRLQYLQHAQLVPLVRLVKGKRKRVQRPDLARTLERIFRRYLCRRQRHLAPETVADDPEGLLALARVRRLGSAIRPQGLEHVPGAVFQRVRRGGHVFPCCMGVAMVPQVHQQHLMLDECARLLPLPLPDHPFEQRVDERPQVPPVP